MKSNELVQLSLITDLPLGEEGKKLTDDGLEFAVYAQVLGNSILSTPGPFTIGILYLKEDHILNLHEMSLDK